VSDQIVLSDEPCAGVAALSLTLAVPSSRRLTVADRGRG